MFKFYLILALLIASFFIKQTFASYSYIKNAQKLAEQELYFTSIPFIKEYLASGNVTKNSSSERLIDRIISNSGVRQFEVLPVRILERSDAPVVRYILAKKYFRKGKYQKAIDKLRTRIPLVHSVKPFALFLEGSIYTIQGKFSRGVGAYKECVRVSKMHINRTSDPNRIRQLYINKDNCVVGIPRAEFGARNYKRAGLSYLDLEKDSYVWPEILFEEAWNSFYLEDYNRTLGKLVTYKAPVFSYIFNPEIEVLKAMAYLHLCLYDDVGKVVQDYYSKYQGASKRLYRLLKRMGRRYKTFFELGRNHYNSKKVPGSLMEKMMSSITKDPAFIEQLDAYNRGLGEVSRLSDVSGRKLRTRLRHNLRLSLELQRDLIGAYVRKNLKNYLRQINKGFEGMTYMKLEVLSRRKKQIYKNILTTSRNRGDIKYLTRNDKQYFWTFNGEFWADELGDYVFALRSECSK